MAYSLKYTLRFKNRIQNHIWRAEIYEKDYADSTIIDLTGAETPLTIDYKSGDTDILTPIKSFELTLSFITDGSITIEDFYSDDDEKFRVDFYWESFSDGSGTEALMHSGYLIQDGVSESVTDQKHLITLKATDNLALLKNVKWNETNDNYFDPAFLGDYLKYSLKQTGLYSPDSTIDQSLPLRTFGNLFENTEPDRSDDDTNDTYSQIILYPQVFQDSDATWQDCYTLLEAILKGTNACLLQALGAWYVVRIPEYFYFTDGEIKGTEFIYNGVTTDITAITLLPSVTIARNGTEVYPINEDQQKTLQRPVKLVRNTFDYDQPVNIKQANLQLPAGATPYDTNTVGDLRYDDYDLATYFPDWVQRDGDTSYLEVVTDTTTDTEQERYIVTPSADDTARGVQFNPISVSALDKIDFSLQYRTFTDTDNMLNFGVRFVLIGESTAYQLIDFPPIISSPNPGLIWDEITFDTWDQGNGVHAYISDSEADDINTSEYLSYSLSGFLTGNKVIPPIPIDGVLLIEVVGTNTYSTSENTTTLWKDINLTIENFINQSVQIVGQIHESDGTSTIKAINEDTVEIDDSPRNSIAGTLFTDALTNFDHTDTVTSEATGIGNIYFTRTRLWHRAAIDESLRLGNIITQERLFQQYTSRLIVEGTFRSLQYGDDRFISPLSLFTIDAFPGRSFIAASMSIDYMDCSFNARLVEIFKDSDIVNASVFLAGTKEEQTDVFTDYVHFDTITNYGGAENYIVVSDTNSKFTYDSDFDTTIVLSVIFFVPISGSGTATFTIEKNGSTIATQTLNAASVFGHISFDLTESVTNGDYFQAFIDPGSANVDIQSGSINITVNDAMSANLFPYSFTYKYDLNNGNN